MSAKPTAHGQSGTRSRAPATHFAPIQTDSQVDAVVDQIIDHIRSGDLPSGTLFPGERQLAVAMRVSRRTIRNALEILQDAGVVHVSPGPAGGARVASIWIPDSLERDEGASSADEVFQALEARRVVEPRVAQLAALRGTDDDFRVMRETIELQSASRRDVWKVNQGNVIFHRQLWRAARNPQLEAAMRSIYRRLSGAFFNALKQDETTGSTELAIGLHTATLDAIMSGRPELTEAVMDEHLAYLEHRCEVAFGRARVPEIPAFLIAERR